MEPSQKEPSFLSPRFLSPEALGQREIAQAPTFWQTYKISIMIISVLILIIVLLVLYITYMMPEQPENIPNLRPIMQPEQMAPRQQRQNTMAPAPPPATQQEPPPENQNGKEEVDPRQENMQYLAQRARSVLEEENTAKKPIEEGPESQLQKDTSCNVITRSGKPCTLKAVNDGKCHMHK